MAIIRKIRGHEPQVGENTFLAETAVFSGAHTFFMGEELHTESKHVIIPP